ETPLSLLSGLADGLALKDRATDQLGPIRPNQRGSPDLHIYVVEIQRNCSRHTNKPSDGIFGAPNARSGPKNPLLAGYSAAPRDFLPGFGASWTGFRGPIV